MTSSQHNVPHPHGYDPHSGRAPGEQPRRSWRWLWIALLVAGVLAWYWRR